MNVDSLNNKIEIIKTSEDFKEIVQTIIEIIRIKKIWIYIDNSNTDLNSKDLIDVKNMADSEFLEVEPMISWFNLVIKSVNEFLKNLHTNTRIDYRKKYNFAQVALQILKKERDIHNPNNRMLFFNDPLLYIKRDKEELPVDFDRLRCGEDFLIRLGEYFSIRKEALHEITRSLEKYIQELDFNEFLYSPIRMKNKGKYVITELILALEHNKELMDSPEPPYDHVKKELCATFGISSEEYSAFRISILERKDDNVGKSLRACADSLEDHPGRRQKKRGKKS